MAAFLVIIPAADEYNLAFRIERKRAFVNTAKEKSLPEAADR